MIQRLLASYENFEYLMNYRCAVEAKVAPVASARNLSGRLLALFLNFGKESAGLPCSISPLGYELDCMDRIKGFPTDGQRWWVRWVDHVELPSGGTASPGIRVLLSRLPDNTGKGHMPSFGMESRNRTAPKICSVLAGAIPGLTIGTVFRDGIRVGRLNAESISVAFEFGKSRSFIWPVRPSKPALLPLGWPKGWPHWLLSIPSYPLWQFRSGNCLILHDEEKSVIIPCFEIFRALYAPHQEIALALLTGPWDLQWPQVANPDHTCILPDGNWQIGLRRRIRNMHAPLLANLILSPAGKAAANGLYTALLEALQRSAAPSPPELDAEPFIGLRASLPFEWRQLRMRLRGMRLPGNPPKCFAIEITHISWPPPPFSPHLLWYHRDNSGTPAEEPTPSDLPPPFSLSEQDLVVGEDGLVPVTSEDDPRRNPQSEAFEVAGPVWEDVPPMRETPKAESFDYQGARRQQESEPGSGTSPGNPGGGDSELIRSEYRLVPRRAPSHRFVDLIELLRRLKQKNTIEDWRIVHPPHAGIEFEDGTVAWPFITRRDAKRAWCYIDRKEDRVRGVLVCEVRMPNAAVNWLEVETRVGSEAFRAVLFRAAPDEQMLVVTKLMRLAEKREARWPPREVLSASVGVSAIRTWKHWYKGGRLDPDNALRALRVVAAA